MKPLNRTLAAVLLAGGAAIGGFAGTAVFESTGLAHAEPPVQATPQQLSTISDLSTVFRNIGKAMSPSVVNIQVRKTISMKGDNGQAMPFPPDMLKRFFQNPDQGDDGDKGGGGDGQNNADEGPQVPDNNGSYEQVGTGSGVIMDVDGKTGYILTNNHVVDGATDVRVTMPDRREYKARVIGTDAETDIALIKIDATNLPAITIGNSAKLQIGDAVLAIGNPFGVGQTVTMGIVSATGRTGLGIEKYEDFIQTDASINPGNSGGAL
ncbi:MAG TPA: trypsin-like peptidase domain-containing protein, partial [Tepidisphaeraceae bacterium]|nr:trypsin-like peptidase domain-containing protein [Tepidisphaeraceae bacterium]